jgi:hypothetical protein
MKYGMNRQWFAVGTVLVALLAPFAGPAAASSDDPLALVRSIYTKAATPGSNALPERDFLALLSADLRKIWQSRGQLRGKPVGDGARLRLAVFGPSAGSGHDLEVKNVINIPGLPKEKIVAVEFSAGAETRQVFVHLAPDAGGWLIVNIIYDEGDDFRHSAEQLAQTAG